MLNRKYWFILLSPLTYSLGLVFSKELGVIGFIISILSAIIFFIFILYSTTITRYDKRINIAVYILIIFSLLSFIITIYISYTGVRAIFLNSYLILPYLSIIISTRKFNINVVSVLINVLTISGLIFIFYSLLNLTDLLSMNSRDAYYILQEENISFDVISKRLCACCGFLILILPYLKNWRQIIAIGAILLNFTLALFLARRNIIFTNSLFILFGILNYILYSKLSSIAKKLLLIVSLASTILVAINFTSFIKSNNNDFFFHLSERFDTDTRSPVSDAFYNEMNSNAFYWIVGKGINSKYFCPGIETGNYRSTVETGWQHITLKLGLIGLILILYILIRAMRKKKTNILISASIMYILTYILELLPAGVPNFDLRFILVWLCVSFCINPYFHNMSNEEIKQLINK